MMPPPKKPKTGPTTAEQFLTEEELKRFQAESSSIQQKLTSGKRETLDNDESREAFGADSSSELERFARRSNKRFCDDETVPQAGSSSDTTDYSLASTAFASETDPAGRSDLGGSGSGTSATIPSSGQSSNDQIQAGRAVPSSIQEYSVHQSSVSKYQILRRLFAHAKSPKSTSESSTADQPSGTISSYSIDDPPDQSATSTTSVDVTEVPVTNTGGTKTLTCTDIVSSQRDANISNKSSAGILQGGRKGYLSSYISQTPKPPRLTEEPSAGCHSVQRQLAARYLQEQPFDLTLKCKDTQFNGAIVDPTKNFISKSSSRVDSTFEHLSSASENYLRHHEQQQPAQPPLPPPSQTNPPPPPPPPPPRQQQQQKKVKLEREPYVITTSRVEGNTRTQVSQMLVKHEEVKQEDDGSHHIMSILTGKTDRVSTESTADSLIVFNVGKTKTSG